jgi:hypothetical protein
VELLLRRPRETLLLHHASDDLAQLFHLEGLLDVVDRVELHALHRGVQVREPGEDHDRDVAVELADPLEHLDAVELRHHQIEDDQVKAALTHLVLCNQRVLDALHRESILFEDGGHVFANRLVVVDDEDSYLRDLDRHERASERRLAAVTVTLEPMPVPGQQASMHFVRAVRLAW